MQFCLSMAKNALKSGGEKRLLNIHYLRQEVGCLNDCFPTAPFPANRMTGRFCKLAGGRCELALMSKMLSTTTGQARESLLKKLAN
jgi:hypothetical protein